MEPSSVTKSGRPQVVQPTQDHDQELEESLSRMYDAFQSKVDTLLRYANEVSQICSASLNASNVRHIPITKRIKSWESAKSSIRRQYHEYMVRRRLRDAVEAKGRGWEEYCREMGIQSQGNEMEAFETPAQMLALLQDFGGLRISLYFPGDVERVAGILQDHLDVIKMTNKRQGSGAKARRMEELVDRLQYENLGEKDAHNGTELTGSVHREFARTFSGYKATHFIAKLREEDIPEDRKYAWKDVVVEIQVGTLVMHVWSEIEHDMIYKPLESQGEGISDDEERLLDLINGIVLTGEAALQQLEASTAKRLNRRAANKDAVASSYFELATWIEKDCQALDIPLTGSEWRLLDRLYDILMAMGKHKHFEVTSLLEEAATYSSSRQTFPMAMLVALCLRSQLAHLEWPIFDGMTIMALAQNARLWAIRLVNSLNLAIYLGVGDEFVNTDVQVSPPSLVSFLDILHPHCPSYTSAETAERIAEFCRAIVDREPLPHPTMRNRVEALHVVKMLTRANMVVSIAGSKSSNMVLVPNIITRLLPVGDVAWSGRRVDEGELWGILDFIEFYVSRDGDKVDSHLDIWDRLTGQSVNRQHNGLANQRFFLPRPSLQGQGAGLWQLVDRPGQLEVVRLDFETSQTKAEVRRNSSEYEKGLSNGILELAYCLFPASQHQWVRKAWAMARALRPGIEQAHVRFQSPDFQGSTAPTDEGLAPNSLSALKFGTAEHQGGNPGPVSRPQPILPGANYMSRTSARGLPLAPKIFQITAHPYQQNLSVPHLNGRRWDAPSGEAITEEESGIPFSGF